MDIYAIKTVFLAVATVLVAIFTAILASVPAKTKVHRAATLLCVFVAGWTGSSLFGSVGYFDPIVNEVALKLSFGLLICSSFALLNLIILVGKGDLPVWYSVSSHVVFVISIVAFFVTDTVVEGLVLEGGTVVPILGTGYQLYNLVTGGLLLASFAFSVYFVVTAGEQSDRANMGVIMLAVAVSLIGSLVLALAIGYDPFIATVLECVTFSLVAYTLIRNRYLNFDWKNYPVKTKFVAPIAGFSVLLTLVAGGLLYFSQQTSLEDGAKRALQTSALANQAAINTWLEEKKTTTAIISSSVSITNLLQGKKGTEAYKLYYENSIQRLSSVIAEDPTILKITVLTIDGEVLVSSDDSPLDFHDLREATEAFESGRNFIEDVHYSEGFGERCLDIGVPTFDSTGTVLGGVILDFSIAPLERMVSASRSLSTTGEVYLAKDTGKVFSQLRHLDNRVDELELTDDQMRACRVGDYSTPMITTVGYNQERVYQVSAPIEDIKWCLLEQYSFSEIYAGLNVETVGIVVVGMLALVVLVLLVNIEANLITKPIQKLNESTKRVAAGDLDYDVRLDTDDEIGDLSASFFEMTKAIKRSRAHISQQVEAQTQTIQKNEEALEQNQKALLNVLEDIEEEKTLVQSEKDKINTMLFSIGDGVFVTDLDGKIVLFNNAAGIISGYTEEEALNQPVEKILKFVLEKDNTPNYTFIEKAVKTGVQAEMANHTLIITKDGRKVPVADSAAPLKNKEGKVIGCVVVFRDVSHERAVDRMKTEFVSLASHQLKTPLTAIRWYTDMLKDQSLGKLTPKQQEMVESIYAGSRRMVRLINDLLSISRLESGRIKVTPVKLNLIEEIQKTIDTFAPYCGKGKCSITFNKPRSALDPLPLDETLFAQVLTNLISNAIRYSPKDRCEITVTLTCPDKKSKDGVFTIAVADKGIGIPEKAKARIFEKFFRSDNAIKTTPDGSGLGLYVVKTVVETVGGKIWFESKEGKGSTFSFTIPADGMKERAGEKSLAVNEV